MLSNRQSKRSPPHCGDGSLKQTEVQCELRADAGLVAVEVVREPYKEINSDWVLFHLREAEEELKKTIAGSESTPDYGYGEFIVAVTHVYHHLDTAWNSKTKNQATGSVRRSGLLSVAPIPDRYRSWGMMAPPNKRLQPTAAGAMIGPPRLKPSLDSATTN